MKEIVEILAALQTLGDTERAVLATVVDVEGSGYRLPGARMLLLPDGRTFGTVSGGCLEADVVERAKRVLVTGVTDTFAYDTTAVENSVFSMNLGCRGVIRVRFDPVGRDSEIIAKMNAAYFERIVSDEFTAPIAIQVFGAGADAVPLVRIAAELGWTIKIHDHRPAFLTDTRFPAASELLLSSADTIPPIAADDRTAAVVMTHNYVRDKLLLPVLLTSAAFYVGVLGPRRRTEDLLADLAAEGKEFSEDELTRLYAPIGLDIGADTPEGIALAILAEIQGVIRHRLGGSLRYREGSIYDRK